MTFEDYWSSHLCWDTENLMVAKEAWEACRLQQIKDLSKQDETTLVKFLNNLSKP